MPQPPATPQDAVNEQVARYAGLEMTNINCRYARARVGRWPYNGEIRETEGSAPVFHYTDRADQTRSTTRFTELDRPEGQQA
ncbi:hypothetical protein ACIOG4_27760 [Streptomyces microflavus]|uniref:hypothetical protein n=1 Tax=Streptomyces microflavus TaxID=1919 RepID=UPI0037F2D621